MAYKTKDEKGNDKILETAKKRFKVASTANETNRKNHIDDMKFRAGEQWDPKIKQQRDIEERPCLTINKLPASIHQITNDQRQNRPAINISPSDDKADKETADVLQGLVRNAERNSNADTAYDVAFDAAVSGGRGWFGLISDYCDPYSFDQELRFLMIRNPLSVLPDPSYTEPDGSDMNWAFRFEDMLIDDYKNRFPNSKAHDSQFVWRTDDEGWITEEKARVADYYEKKLVSDKLILLPDRSTILKSEVDALSEEGKDRLELSDKLIQEYLSDPDKTRDTLVPKVFIYKMCGFEILSETTFPSQWIPLFPVHGEELLLENKRIFEGIIRQAKDAQRMYNYWKTCETETIALAPKAPWVGVEGQFEGHEAAWDNANRKPVSRLEYKDVTLNDNKSAPPPQRQYAEPPVAAITNATRGAADDIKTTTEHSDASMGIRSNETSGKAITARIRQGQTGNFHFVDNLARSIRHSGRVFVDATPIIYSTERWVTILGEDDREEIVKLNARWEDKSGKSREAIDFSVGKYDCVISSGPSFATRRQETAEYMLDLSKSYPALSQVAGDIMVGALDFHMSDEIAKRLKKTIDPKFLETDDENQIPQAVLAQMEEMKQMIAQLESSNAEAQDTIKTKTLELESNERIANSNNDTKIRIKDAELKAKEDATPDDLNSLAAGLSAVMDRLDLLRNDEPVDEDAIAESLEAEIASGNNINNAGEMPVNDGEMPSGE